MIIKSLYESLTNSLNEARLNRTIDKKLWLTVASICSRNKSTEAEFIKPMSKMTKDELLQRYVAALLIMKKQCPNDINDFDKIKTFKLIAKKFIELGGTIDDIKNLYVQNGGSGVSVTIPASNNLVNNLNQDLNKSTEQQVKEEPNNLSKTQIEDKIDDLDIDELPDGINTYELIQKYVNKKYNNIQEISKNIYELMDSTYFILNKSFHKITVNNNIVYFTKVYIDKNKKFYFGGTNEIFIKWVCCNSKKIKSVEEGILSIVVNNMYVNQQPLSKNIDLTNNITISQEQLIELLKIIYAKFLYITQAEYDNPFVNVKRTKSFEPISSFKNYKLDLNKSFSPTIVNKICRNLFYKFKIKDLKVILGTYLNKYKIGNKKGGEQLLLNSPYMSVNVGGRRHDSSVQLRVKGIEIRYFSQTNVTFRIIADVYIKNTYQVTIIMSTYIYDDSECKYLIDFKTGNIFMSSMNIYVNDDIMNSIIVYSLAVILYYLDNYDLLLK